MFSLILCWISQVMAPALTPSHTSFKNIISGGFLMTTNWIFFLSLVLGPLF